MCDTTNAPQEETRQPNNETWKQQMDKRGHSGTYRSPTNPSNKGSTRKGGGMQHNQDQNAPKSGVSHVLDLKTKIPNNWNWQTRRVPTDDEILQDSNWRDRNHFRNRKNSIPKHNVTRGSSKIIRRHRKSSWKYHNGEYKIDQGGFTKQAEMRHEARNEKNLEISSSRYLQHN